MSPAFTTYTKGLYGVPLSAAEDELFRRLSNGVSPRPGEGWLQGLANAGRGSGKDDTLSTFTGFECVHGGHEISGAPGQRLPSLVICPLRNQAVGSLKMVQGIAALPQVRRHVANVTRDSVEFKNGTVAMVQTFDDVAVAGDTVIQAHLNEWALAPGSDAAVSDFDLKSNLLPALRQVRGAPPHRLLMWTSSYIQDGDAWETFRDHYGVNTSDVLVFHGGTTDFNPNIDPAYLDRMRRLMTASEYAMHFESVWLESRKDGWFGEVLESCVDRDVDDRDPAEEVRYWAAIDAAFRGDRFALAICHVDDAGRVVLDVIEKWAPERGRPLSVARVVAESARVLKSYGCRMALADQFSFDPLRELYRERGIILREAPWTSESKPFRFRLVRDAMTDNLVRLLDDRDLLREFHAISGTLLRSGGERIEAKRGHDDLVHAVVLAMSEAMTRDAHGRARRGSDFAGLAVPDLTHILTVEDRALGKEHIARVIARHLARGGWYELPQAERRRRFLNEE